jgi:hypothetical protein
MKIKRPTREQGNLKNAHVSAILMIIKVVSDIHHEHHENQVIEIKPVNHIDLRPGRQKEKDVKNEGRSGDVDENKWVVDTFSVFAFGISDKNSSIVSPTNRAPEPGAVIRFVDLEGPSALLGSAGVSPRACFSKRLLNNRPNCHPEEPQATKDLRICLILQMQRFFASLRMTAPTSSSAAC